MTKHIYFAAFVVDDEDYGCATDTDEIVQYLSNVTTDEGLSNFMVWDNAESLIADHVERGPLTVAYLEGDDQDATDAAPSAPQTPAPDWREIAGSLVGLAAARAEEMENAVGEGGDAWSQEEADEAWAAVEAARAAFAGNPAPQTPKPDASALMLAALRLAAERIEMNNYGGEEDEALAEINAAIAAAEGRA